jgi:hypothetical protein
LPPPILLCALNYCKKVKNKKRSSLHYFLTKLLRPGYKYNRPTLALVNLNVWHRYWYTLNICLLNLNKVLRLKLMLNSRYIHYMCIYSAKTLCSSVVKLNKLMLFVNWNWTETELNLNCNWNNFTKNWIITETEIIYRIKIELKLKKINLELNRNLNWNNFPERKYHWLYPTPLRPLLFFFSLARYFIVSKYKISNKWAYRLEFIIYGT